VTAISSPSASPTARFDPWILGPWRDGILFIGTPLLILPAALLLKRGVALEDMALFVASFGALGHHLPGMLRAYGDRELFRRFRTRFVVAPLFLLAVCIFAALSGWAGLALVVYAWGIWHGLAQTYGFLRIYDAKARSSALWTCRLDFALCVAWFLGVVALSPTRLRELANMAYQSGVPLAGEAWVEGARTLAGIGIVAATAVFLVHAAGSARRGAPPSALKLAVMATTFGFWWFANVHVANLLLGVLLFEVFHDVQYLSIVWAFNRARSAKGADLGGWNRALFRGGLVRVGLYVALVFAYGALNYGAQGLATGALRNVAMGALAASALLHFYYDGFIWKVRERATAQSLGLAGGREGGGTAGLRHAAKWLLLLVPLGGLALAQGRGVEDELARSAVLARDFGQAKDHLYLGGARLAGGEPERAAQAFRAALERDPGLLEARVGLGDAHFYVGDLASAEEAYREVLGAAAVAAAHTGLGNVLGARGDLTGALLEYQRAVELDSAHIPSRASLGVALARLGRFPEAVTVQRAILDECPDCPSSFPVQRDLAQTLEAAGRAGEALELLRSAVGLAPRELDLLRASAELELRVGAPERARTLLERVQALGGDDAEASYGLGNAHALLGRPAEAVASYRRALELHASFPEALRNLGTVLFAQGELEEAERCLRRAVTLASDDPEAHARLAEVLRARGFAEEAARHEAISRRLAGVS
jgi:tetratricopeptide (TPR) repeat protein